MGVSVSEARDRLALQQAAAGYAEALIATNPAGFVDLQNPPLTGIQGACLLQQRH